MEQITLRAARVNAGFTQVQAADKSGLSLYLIKKSESEPEQMSVAEIQVLCDLYKVSYNNIFLPTNYPLSE